MLPEPPAALICMCREKLDRHFRTLCGTDGKTLLALKGEFSATISLEVVGEIHIRVTSDRRNEKCFWRSPGQSRSFRHAKTLLERTYNIGDPSFNLENDLSQVIAICKVHQ